MSAKASISSPLVIGDLLRGEAASIVSWTTETSLRRASWQLLIIVLASGAYGAAMGWWRAPMQGLFTAIKFPLIILLTTLGNALINGMLAPLLGLNIPFRQTVMAILMSFTVTAVILGAFSPLIAFMVWNAPPMTPLGTQGATYQVINLTHVVVIAFAGVAGNVRLLQLLTRLSNSASVAGRVLLAWLAINFLLGSQLSWILRPFIGSPALPVEFVRYRTAFESNFFEAVFRMSQTIFGAN